MVNALTKNTGHTRLEENGMIRQLVYSLEVDVDIVETVVKKNIKNKMFQTTCASSML